MTTDEYIHQFDPIRDSRDWVCEEPTVYAKRIQETLLPNWPEEVLVEWLHRHARGLATYAWLGFERFHFEQERWSLIRLPGREAFADPRGFFNQPGDIEIRAASTGGWLAQYMLENGTWPTPIVLLDTETVPLTKRQERPESLRTPIHLLEGHNRLSFLNELRNIGTARSEHDVWVVRLRA